MVVKTNTMNILDNNSKVNQLSPFAQFCLSCRGYRFYTRNGGELAKWEVFAMGYKNLTEVELKNKIVIVKK